MIKWLLILFVFCSCNTQKLNLDSAKNQSMDFSILHQSEYGNAQQAENQLIENFDQMNFYWSRAFQNQSPSPTFPVINWDQKQVIYIHFGEFNYGGNQFDVKSIHQVNDKLIVEISKTSPGLGQPSLTVMTNPVLFILIDKLTKKPTEIEIQYL